MATGDMPANLKFAQTHEWVRVEGDIATIGISEFAQEELGDVVFLDLPWSDAGERVFRAGEHFGDVESVKATSELFAPIGGVLVSVNEALRDQPEIVNRSPYNDGWMLTLRVSDPAELDKLMDADTYATFIHESH
ncbi:MAG TPA: glycine cleavage system protein GcvH [Ktedonobacterales bacterium]|jgi:glycine cleavage system H protein|nr:glycine cleavage system protein GcvH [Ktedonobacterales bacterium]